MKKIYKYLSFAIVFILSIFTFNLAPLKNTNAVVILNSDKNNFNMSINEFLDDFVQVKNRVAGTVGEKQASEKIIDYLDSTLIAKNNNNIKNGVQTFKFESIFTKKYEQSQNIIYNYVVDENSKKKIILSCHYDAVAFKKNSEMTKENIVDSESITGSAGSVATLVALANNLKNLDLKYNVEIVFFGAGESNNAGSQIYTNGISKEDRENIICAINFDNIALGKNVYFYIDEINNDFSKLENKIAKNNKIDVSQVNTANLNKIALAKENELGLDYIHIAMNSDNFNLKKSGIEVLNIFAGDYSNGLVVGRNEFSGKENVCYSENDNRAYIKEHYGQNAVNDNLFEAYKLACFTLTDADLESAVLSAKNSTQTFNMVFANSKLVFYLTIVAFMIFVVIGLYIYHKLSIKSYYANVETEFVSSVLKITEYFDDEKFDPNMTKMITTIVAKDIKKDKTIKINHKKDKNKDKEKDKNSESKNSAKNVEKNKENIENNDDDKNK